MIAHVYFPVQMYEYYIKGSALKQSDRISGDSAVYYISKRFNLNETEI